MRRHFALSLLSATAAVGLLAAGCTDTADKTATPEAPTSSIDTTRYTATITRTTDGVPHITAPDYQGVLYGQGWASAEDHACDLADQVIKIRSERAKFLGAGEGDANINSDFAWKAIGIDAIAREDYPKQDDQTHQAVTAFTAGWNEAVAKIGLANLKGWCAGASWVRELSPEDLYSYIRSITLSASSSALAQYLGAAQPPDAAAPVAKPASFDLGPATGQSGSIAGLAPIASNGWAFGGDTTANGKGALLANPHFPWEGALRFWEVHLTVPGFIDIYGAQLSGLPSVAIGFNHNIAWTHTVSAGHRFVAYKLALKPGDPKTYLVDGVDNAMTGTETSIDVLQADGTTAPTTRTLWSSKYGPILNFPGVGWNDTTTLALKDANLGDDEFFPQYLAMPQAKSMDEFKDIHKKFTGVPLFNTIATDDQGNAWYADTSATPNLSKEAQAAYTQALENDAFTKTAADNGAVLLDGSTSANDWVDTPGARDPGLVPFDQMPQTERRDHVFNANDSFWVANATSTLDGDYSFMHGDQGTERSLRTRENAVVLKDLNKVDLDVITEAGLRNEAYSARLYKDEVVAKCTATPTIEIPGLEPDAGTPGATTNVDLAPACAILKSWDGRYNGDSKGAVLWREFWSAAGSKWDDTTKFDETRPVDTPAGITVPADAVDDPILSALGKATQVLALAKLALDVPLAEVQHDGRLETGDPNRVGIGGGTGGEGLTNVVGWSKTKGTLEPTPKRPDPIVDGSSLTDDGYWVNNGSSFIMAVTFTDQGPMARSILTYGNTEDRTSPWFTVQTKRFVNKDWKPVAFTAEQITAAKIGEPESVSGPRR